MDLSYLQSDNFFLLAGKANRSRVDSFKNAKSDGANMLPLDLLGALLVKLTRIHQAL
jgi:hypothetical protein